VQVTLPDELNLPDRAAAAGFPDVAAYLAELVERDAGPFPEYVVDPKSRRVLTEDELRAELQKGLDSIERGDVGPLDIEAVRRRAHQRHAAETVE